MIDIKLGYTCNNNCVFCAVKNHEQKDRIYEEYDELITKERKTNNIITITGGEVTIRKDFFKILSRAYNLGYKINIQSNGRMFSNPQFTRDVSFFNISEFLISIHGHNEDIHESLTRTKGSFEETVSGIENLIEMENNVITNTVLMKESIEYIKDLCILLKSLSVKKILLSYPDITGGSLQNIDKIPTLSETKEHIPEITDVCNKLDIQPIFDNVPLCIMGKYSKYNANKSPVNLMLLDTTINNFIPNTIINKCKQCKLVDICCHPQEIYIDRFGDDEIKLIT